MSGNGEVAGGRWQVEGRANTRRPDVKHQVCIRWPEPLSGAMAGPGEAQPLAPRYPLLVGQESDTAETAGWQCWAVSYDMSEGVARTAELEGHTGEAGESLKMRRA